MKNIKTKIVLPVAIFLSAVGVVSATTSSLYVSPANATKNVGEVSVVSIGVNSLGNKVCGAEGTLVFNNLSCLNITVASGLMAQSSPTCSNPYFLVGIPSCTTVDKDLFTVSVKVGSAGIASISATSVDVIGEGKSVGSALVNGTYTINAVITPAPVVPTPITPVTPKIPAIPTTKNNDEYIGYVNGKIQTFSTLEAAQKAGATGIEPNYKLYPTQVVKVATTTNEEITPLATTTDTVNPKSNNTVKIIIGIIVLALIGCGGYIYKKKNSQKV